VDVIGDTDAIAGCTLAKVRSCVRPQDSGTCLEALRAASRHRL